MLFLPIVAASQWQKIENLPSPYDQNYWLEIFFLPQNTNYAWICGYNGMVLRSTDAGKTWEGTQLGNAGQIESIIFLNERVGYCVSVSDKGFDSRRSRVFRSNDGGRTWKDASPRTNVAFWGGYFIDENIGVVVGGSCDARYFFSTQDGGETWSFQIHTNDREVSDSKLSDVRLFPSGIGYAVSSGFLWQSQDFGKTWEMYHRIDDNDWHEELAMYKSSVLVPMDEECQGSQRGGGVLFSEDRGLTWRLTKTRQACYGSFLIDEKVGWVCGLNRTILKTTDAGRTWSSKSCGIPPGTDLDDLYFINDTTGWVVGEGVYKYTPFKDTMKPTISSEKNKICGNDFVVIKADTTYPEMTWNTGERGNQIIVNKPGTYYLIASTNECDSGMSNPITIELYPRGELKYDNNNFSACEGDSVRVKIISPNNGIEWFDGNKDLTRHFSEAGWKTFAWTDTTGCTYYDSLLVKIYAMPKAKLIASVDTVICKTHKLKVKSVGTPAEVDWFRADNNQQIASMKSEIELDEAMSIYVVAYNELGCADTSEIYTYNIDFEDDIYSIIAPPEPERLLDFDSLASRETSCKDVLIRNNHTKKVATLTRVYTLHNKAFSIPQSQLPMKLNPGEVKPLTLCYSPTEYGEQRDTLIIEDYCSTHRVFLQGYAKPWQFVINTKCDIEVTISSKSLNKAATFSTNMPYPNPAGKVVSLDYAIKYEDANLSINEVAFSIVDVLGREVPIEQERITKQVSSKIANSETGYYEIELPEITRGQYQLVLTIEGKRQIYNLIIN